MANESLMPPSVDTTPRQPNNNEVICPNCIHQFRAIPVNVQTRLNALEKLCNHEHTVILWRPLKGNLWSVSVLNGENKEVVTSATSREEAIRLAVEKLDEAST